MNLFSFRFHISSRTRFLASLFLCTLAISLSACGQNSTSGVGSNASNPPSAGLSPAEAERDGTRIAEQYRTLDHSKDSVTRMHVRILEENGQSRDLDLRISKKREADGELLMLSEFLAPAEERDRNALVTLKPQGDIEGTRYIQSNDSFATVKGATNEDSLFGMTIQEMVDGQPEKYDFRLVGEETFNQTPVYRLEGKLKAGADSKFPRLVTLIAKDSYAVQSAEFYDNKNDLLRRVIVSEVKQINGYWTRMRWTIENLAKKMRLEFVVQDVQYDRNISSSIFSKANLKKSAFKPI